MLEADQCFLYGWPRPVNNYVGNVDGLVLFVQGYGDVDEIKEFFDGVKDGRDRFMRISILLHDNVFAINEFLRH